MSYHHASLTSNSSLQDQGKTLQYWRDFEAPQCRRSNAPYCAQKKSWVRQHKQVEAKNILKPLVDQYIKTIEDQQWDKTVAFFDEDGVLVQAGKKGVYGKEAIKQELQEFDKLAGKRKMTKIISDTYQMTQDYVIITTDYESTTEKMGVLKGKATQIWKKSNNKYLIYHEMFSIA
ncbi:hypothetical protein Aduo_011370 [Ancylostoma duodenale]